MTRADTNLRFLEVQCGFVEDCGNQNAIFILSMLSAIQMKQHIDLCFIDWDKAELMKHKHLMDMLKELDINAKEVWMIRALYWNQTVAVRMENSLGSFTQKKKGVRQGCAFSPDLFSLYCEKILREIEELPGLVIGGVNLNNLQCGDDTVLLAESEGKLQEPVEKIDNESEKRDLRINCKKTGCDGGDQTDSGHHLQSQS